MRDVPADILAHLQKTHGTEPILIVEIQWTDGGPLVAYSDQKISGEEYPYPTILQVGDFDMAMQVDGSGDSQQINITLDDTNGELKTLIDTADIHKRPVWVYQGFQGLSPAHRFLLFKGELSSPIVWNEGERTLSFDVLTRQEDAEVGFSMEEGDFLSVPSDALGKAWPLVFGEVCNMEVVKVRAPRKGYMVSGEGIHDFTLWNRICQARELQCPAIYTGNEMRLSGDPFSGNQRVDNVPVFAPDYDCADARWETVCQLENLLTQQRSYENSSFEVDGGNEFPQGVTVTLNINGAKFVGYFNGTTFNVNDRFHPEYDDITLIPCRNITERARGLIVVGWFTTEDEVQKQLDGNFATWDESDAGSVYTPDPRSPNLGACVEEGEEKRLPGLVGGPHEAQAALDAMPESSFFWIPPGTEVFLEEEGELLNIISLLPGTVNNVAAYKKQPLGNELLLEVPAAYYTIYETDYDGYTVVEIGMDRKLSQRDSDWDDTLYVSFTSDVGPNPVDIIQWLVEKYTSLTVDTTSFTAVHTSMTNYPTNFALKSRVNVLSLIQDIAYQTRCAVFIRNGVMFIKYLSEEPTSVRTITASDILSQSFQVSHTPSEDLVTKSEVKWQSSEAPIEKGDEVEKTIMLKYNIPKYGVHEEDYDYFTQNTYGTILKSATFWLIRDSHTWKYVEFDTSIKHLDLDLFDCITLNLPQFSASAVKCIITEAQFNNADNTIHFQAWTPVRAGTSEPYSLAWPANQPANTVWPLDGEQQWANPGYAFNITPPLDHILSGGDTTDLENFVEQSSGDRHPSDLDDTLPSVDCEVSSFEDGDSTVTLDPPEIRALNLAQRNHKELLQKDGYTMNWPDQDDNREEEEDTKPEREGCGGPQTGSGCVYDVTVTYTLPTSVSSGKILGGCLGGPCWCDEGGGPCISGLTQKCHSFSEMYAATLFKSQMEAEIQGLKDGCGYYCGTSSPYMVSNVKAIADPENPGETCESPPGTENVPYIEYEPKDV
jgi:hypothetical protein